MTDERAAVEALANEGRAVDTETGEITEAPPLCVNGACSLLAGHDGPCVPSIEETAAPDEADDDSDDLLP